MAQASKSGWTPERSIAGGRNPYLVVMVLSISTFMEVLDTSIANVALRHIAGGLSASYDQATWVLTSYLVANAVVIPLSGWLADVIGRKRFYMLSVALFTAASFLCGLAPNLTFLILARIIQGVAGGSLQPNEQSMLVDSFPPEKRGGAFAVFGVVVILAPTIGPTLGGLITDNLSWHWIFLINVPVGIMSLFLIQIFVDEPELLRKERAERLKKGVKLDFTGFFLIALGLGMLEITMDRGQREDWFSSGSIVLTAVLCVVGLVSFVFWELNHKDPLIDLRLLKQRNFAIAQLVMAVTGVILFGTTQFIPQLLQQVLGYSATTAGMAMTAGGMATLIAMPLAGRLSSKVQARWLIGGALIIEALALWNLTHLSTQADFAHAAWGRVWQAIGIPFLFVPLSSAAYVGIPADKTNQATSIQNISRNIGGTLGISTVQTVLAQREQFHQARIVEGMNPLNPNFANALQAAQHALPGAGGGEAARLGALQNLYQLASQQAQMLAYVDAFKVLMIIIAVAFPIVMLLRSTKPGKGAHA